MGIIHSSILKDVEPVTLNGEKIIDLFPQIKQLFDNNPASHSLRYFFAEPITAVDRQEVHWRSLVSGESQLVAHLTKEEQSRLYEELKIIDFKLGELIASISSSRSRGTTFYTDVLQKMRETPDLKRSLYRVGDQLVLTEWACRSPGAEPLYSDIVDYYSKEFLVPPPPDPFTSTPPGSPNPVSTSSPLQASTAVPLNDPPVSPPSPEPHVDEPFEPPPPPAPPSVAPAERWPFWRWIILLLLLLLLLFGLVRACSDVYHDSLIDRSLQLDGQIEDKILQCANPKTDSSRRVEAQGGQADCRYCVRLIWDTVADLDLFVTEPDGTVITAKTPQSAISGGKHDVDTNFRQKVPNPIEQVIWEKPPPNGKYEITVFYYSLEDIPSFNFRVEVIDNGRITDPVYRGSFDPKKIQPTCKPAPGPAFKADSGTGWICEFSKQIFSYEFSGK